jgi:short-subunit dehydrogenase
MQKGGIVIGTFRKQNEVDEFNKIYVEKGSAFLLDVTYHVRIKEVVRQVISTFKRIDVLVKNAGIGFIGSVEASSIEETRDIFDTNFYSALALTQEVLPLMRKQRSGHIIQISSHGGVKAFAGFGIYNASKFALEGFSEALAQEVAPLGIKVVIVEPGPFRTSFAGSSLKESHKVIYDYSETVGAFKSKIKSIDGHQEGDPVKAASAIIKHLENNNPTLRLPLGKIALTTISSKMESLKNDLEVNKTVAEAVVFD